MSTWSRASIGRILRPPTVSSRHSITVKLCVGSQSNVREIVRGIATSQRVAQEPETPLSVFKSTSDLEVFGQASGFQKLGYIKDLPNGPRNYDLEVLEQSSALLALRARLNLSPAYDLSTLACALTCRTADLADTYVSNVPLSLLGNSLLHYYVSEYVMCTFPRLPIAIIESAVQGYIGSNTLTHVGRGWGIETAPRLIKSDGTLQEQLPLEELVGKLKFRNPVMAKVGTLTEYDTRSTRLLQGYSSAMGSAVRAIIAGVYLHSGSRAAKKFIADHILSRKLDISKLFAFDTPNRELARLCAREGLAPPISRMIAETGRTSSAPVYIVGIYSGSNLLGSAEGQSIREAEIRAAIRSLKAWYLYSPKNMLPSITEENPDIQFQPCFIDRGEIII
ncbi:mitochondrial 54S ribosomal protein mL44 [Lipomyces oligophaga]|uniref:mitochondrial 54S ribosomal protein mL44 n=1 Tax=Lipomyces oligophaga TaxID=45792 RepID=UPI0034CD05CD